MQNEPIITLDIDWAPDEVIDEVASILISQRAKATWFVTHQSPALDRLRIHSDLFELGLHPNFLPSSTHGNTEDEVFQHMRRILPHAIAMRTHSLHQNSRLLAKAVQDFGIQIDASLLLPRAEHLRAHMLHLPGAKLLRIPSFWEDDVEMCTPEPCWDAHSPKLNTQGLKVYNFHPIHVFNNTTSLSGWLEHKNSYQSHLYIQQQHYKHTDGRDGPGTTFRELARRLHNSGRTVSEIVAQAD